MLEKPPTVEKEGSQAVEASFVTVKYGDNQEAIINPWCRCHILLNYIKKVCDCEDEDVVDLCDLQGDVKHLSEKHMDYANTLVKSRETYVLIRVERQGEDEPSKFTALLNDADKSNPDITAKLNRLSTASPTKECEPTRKSQVMNTALKWTNVQKKVGAMKGIRGVTNKRR